MKDYAWLGKTDAGIDVDVAVMELPVVRLVRFLKSSFVPPESLHEEPGEYHGKYR